MVSTSHTILVAEDEEGVRLYLQTFLEMSGYRVLSARNAPEALSLAQDSNIDLLIADLNMPGLTGPELAQKIAPAHPGLKVLIISGYAEPPPNLKGVKDFFFLPKPFTPHRLLKALQGIALTTAG